jgi:hypothetical protein
MHRGRGESPALFFERAVGVQSWIILIVATLLLVAVLYPLLKRPAHAALAAALIFTIGFQIYAWWNLGTMDPFWPIAVVVSGGVSFTLGFAALFAWRHLVERRQGKHDR